MSSFACLAALERDRTPFAIQTVVWRSVPVSSHVADSAIVQCNGTMEGFVGGACSREIVRREAMRSIADGRPRLLRIRPERSGEDAVERDGTLIVPMGCASGGAVDVFIEPHLPLRRLIVVGDTAVAEALARIAAQVPYDVVRVVAAEELDDIDAVERVRPIALGALPDLLALDTPAGGPLLAVVASQGHYDEEALATRLAAEPHFVGVVASRRRAAELRAALAARGASDEDLARVRAPVGLDLQARTPGTVAIAILAELVGVTAESTPVDAAVAVGIDPLCGMEVALAEARFRSEHDEFATALELMLALEKPLLIEGPAALVLAGALETGLTRLQCYEGLDTASGPSPYN
ncbi:hypothetical protein WPS_18290 [Vulcanimicrobium alpinum]|uniref:Xanthine dehydrogenase accessory factor n=1 Tax=Vulcanimicrobium alpinum TaxID=3016050 RepID=A0AAN2CA30_UNVUL|nr:XdhC family protein [Vulcanimicrobium alpinum]BDE06553.1 hypothetical protein WPS_18290 [Vulcanimicrobium alpinum]